MQFQLTSFPAQKLSVSTTIHNFVFVKCLIFRPIIIFHFINVCTLQFILQNSGSPLCNGYYQTYINFLWGTKKSPLQTLYLLVLQYLYLSTSFACTDFLTNIAFDCFSEQYKNILLKFESVLVLEKGTLKPLNN